MQIQKDREDYFEWLKDKGRMKRGLTEIFINKDGVLHTEMKMAWMCKTSPEDYKEFCKETGREYKD
jgi:hypothetical protein